MGSSPHDHGMERARHFDEFLSAFNTNPLVKGDPMTNLVKTNSVKTKSVKLASVLVSLVVLTAGASQAMAAGPTMQEKMACRADAETLCSQFIGKAPQMRACLEQNKAKLSTPCRQVVEAHGG
jgi:hypothetical protein